MTNRGSTALLSLRSGLSEGSPSRVWRARLQHSSRVYVWSSGLRAGLRAGWEDKVEEKSRAVLLLMLSLADTTHSQVCRDN